MRMLRVLLLLVMALTGCSAKVAFNSASAPATPTGSAVVTNNAPNSVQVDRGGAHVSLNGRTYLGLAIGLAIIDGVAYIGRTLRQAFSPAPEKPQGAKPVPPSPYDDGE